MSVFRCNSCGGTYADAAADGTVYFHVCAPVDDPDTGNSRRRLDARDENLIPLRGTRPPSIRAEGQGVKCLSVPRLDEPAWISRLKDRAAKEEDA